MTVYDLPTPCLLVERDRLAGNIRRMQELASKEDVHLRPHVKTHKSIAIARKQLEAGARGITVAKPSEALVFATAGIGDIRIAYTLATRHHFEALAKLSELCNPSFCVDTMEAARAASDHLSAIGRTVDVLLEIDCEYGRCGIRWDSPDLPEFAGTVSRLPALNLIGILSHAGQTYKGPADGTAALGATVRSAAETERRCMLEVAGRLQQAQVKGVEPDNFEISIGSTPAMRYFRNETRGDFRITELRPGNYVFYDAMQVALGSAALTDCALTAYASVISKHRDADGAERLYLDAGRKVLTSDTGTGTEGFGILLHSPKTMQPLPHARIAGLSEEHGWVTLHGGSTLAVRDRVRIVPNHACTAVNTQDRVYLVDRETVLEKWPVDARGKSE